MLKKKKQTNSCPKVYKGKKKKRQLFQFLCNSVQHGKLSQTAGPLNLVGNVSCLWRADADPNYLLRLRLKLGKHLHVQLQSPSFHLTRSMSMVSKSIPSLRSSIRPSDDIITSSTIGSSSSSMSPVLRRLQAFKNGIPWSNTAGVRRGCRLCSGVCAYMACCRLVLSLA